MLFWLVLTVFLFCQWEWSWLMQCFPGFSKCSEIFVMQALRLSQVWCLRFTCQRLLWLQGRSVWLKMSGGQYVHFKLYHSHTIQNHQRDALNIIYSSNIITLLYMFRVSSTHLQEDIVVHKQHMVSSLSIRVLVSCWYAAIGRTLPLAAYQQDTRTLIESDGTICCLCTTMSSWRWVLDTRNM